MQSPIFGILYVLFSSVTNLDCAAHTSVSQRSLIIVAGADLPALLWWCGGRGNRRGIPQGRNCCSARTRFRRGVRRHCLARPGRRTTRCPCDPATVMRTPLSASRTTCDPSDHIPWPHVPRLRRTMSTCAPRGRHRLRAALYIVTLRDVIVVVVVVGSARSVTKLTPANPPPPPSAAAHARGTCGPPVPVTTRHPPRSFIIDTSRVLPSTHLFLCVYKVFKLVRTSIFRSFSRVFYYDIIVVSSS